MNNPIIIAISSEDRSAPKQTHVCFLTVNYWSDVCCSILVIPVCGDRFQFTRERLHNEDQNRCCVNVA